MALGALGVNAAVFATAFFVFNFLSYGTTPFVARAMGSGRRDEVGSVVVTACLLSLAIGAAVTVALITLASPILALMGASEELLPDALRYLEIRALASPAVMLIMVGHGAFRGLQDTRTPLVVTLLLNLVNLVLDPLMIFGLGWGVAGAAWATTIAQWVGALAFLLLLFGPARWRRGPGWRMPDRKLVLRFLGAGNLLFVRTLFLISTMTLATAIATRIGTVAVAAHQVAVQLWIFLALVVDSIAIAGQALIGQELGRGDSARARALADRMLGWGLAIGIGLGIAFLAMRGRLPRVFTDDPVVLASLDSVYLFVAVMQPLNAIVFVWDGIYIGAGAFRYLSLQMLLSAAVAWALLGATLPLDWGLPGVWWAFVALMAMRMITLGVRYWRGGEGHPLRIEPKRVS